MFATLISENFSSFLVLRLLIECGFRRFVANQTNKHDRLLNMPTHADDISVGIYHLHGPKYKEYDNPHFQRPDDFRGSVASRLITAPPGNAFEVRVRFGKDFKLFNATGVEIVIAIGESTERLSWDDNSQVFFIKLRKSDLPCEHRFTRFTTWKSHHDPDSKDSLYMQMPQPIQSNNTASTAWLLDDAAFDANPGCVSVFVTRGHLDGRAQVEKNITNPPAALR